MNKIRRVADGNCRCPNLGWRYQLVRHDLLLASVRAPATGGWHVFTRRSRALRHAASGESTLA